MSEKISLDSSESESKNHKVYKVTYKAKSATSATCHVALFKEYKTIFLYQIPSVAFPLHPTFVSFPLQKIYGY